MAQKSAEIFLILNVIKRKDKTTKATVPWAGSGHVC